MSNHTSGCNPRFWTNRSNRMRHDVDEAYPVEIQEQRKCKVYQSPLQQQSLKDHSHYHRSPCRSKRERHVFCIFMVAELRAPGRLARGAQRGPNPESPLLPLGAAPRACKPALCGIAATAVLQRGGPRTFSSTTAARRVLGTLCLLIGLGCADSANWQIFLVSGGGFAKDPCYSSAWRAGARAFGPAPASRRRSSWEVAGDEVAMEAPDAAQQQHQAAWAQQQAAMAAAAAAQQQAATVTAPTQVEQAAMAAAEHVASAASQQRRSEQLARLVQRPDIYRPETRDQETDQWVDWRFSFVSYLGVIDSKFAEEIEWVEAQAGTEKLMANMDLQTQVRARELYAILLSFVRNRPAKLVRAIPHNNGYEAWRQLVVEMMPSSRQRQLALVTQLTSTRLDPKQALGEQLGRYEELIREYERVSGTKYAEDLMISTLVSAAPPALQAQLHMALGEDTTYRQVRDKVLLYERSTAKWQSGSTLAMPSLHSGTGPVPMEVDRVQDKGGKKGKGKKGSPDQKGSKGKPGKGKQQQKGKGKGNKASPECYACGKRGHYARDCWNPNPKGKGKGQRVHQVEQTEQQAPIPPSSSASSTSSTAAPSVSSAGQAARGVRLVRMVTPPHAPILEVYDMASDVEEEAGFDFSVCAVTFLKYKGAVAAASKAATEGETRSSWTQGPTPP